MLSDRIRELVRAGLLRDDALDEFNLRRPEPAKEIAPIPEQYAAIEKRRRELHPDSVV